MTYDTKMIEEEDEHQKEVGSSTDLYLDIRRLDAILKKLTIRFKKAANKGNDELLVKLANAVGLMSSKKFEIVCLVLKVDEILKPYKPK